MQASSNFRTILTPPEYTFDITYRSKIMFIGSCFTERIGEKLQELKFKTDINPFGILYNPFSLKNALQFLILERKFNLPDLFYHDERWHSFYHHGKFSGSDKVRTLTKINERLLKSSENLQDADFLFITFGTAWIYEYIETGEIVSNCHKLPGSNFRRRLLNIDEITVEYFQLINSLENLCPDLKIIFTISPVRHLKDGHTQNLLSKSILMVAVQQIIERFDNAFYFPAYEIMIDDLRDYRFFASDMLHPNEIAVDYINQIFRKSFFSKETNDISEKIREIVKARNHKVLYPDSKSYRKFLQKISEKISRLTEMYPYIDFSEEKQFFSVL